MRERTKRGLRRLGSGLLALAMALSLLPAMGPTAQAADDPQEVVLGKDQFFTFNFTVDHNYVDYDDDGNQILPVSVQIEKNAYNWYTYNSYRKGWSYDQWSPNFGSYDYGNTYYSLSVSLASNNGSTVKASTRGENSAIVHYYSSGWGFSNREAYKQGHEGFQGDFTISGTKSDQDHYGLTWQYLTYDFSASSKTLNLPGGANTVTLTAHEAGYKTEEQWTDSGRAASSFDPNNEEYAKNYTDTITLYAPYELTLDLNDEDSEENIYNGEITYANGCYVFPDEDPTREGYDFLYWTTEPGGGGTIVRAGDSSIKYYKTKDSDTLTFDEDTTLYAQWLPKGTYQVTLRDTYSSESKTVTVDNAEYTLPGVEDLGWEEYISNPSYEYHFTGWRAASGDQTYAAGKVVTLSPGENIFTAVREECYRVTFDRNLLPDEKLLEPNAWIESMVVKKGEELTLPGVDTWTTSRKLTGWSTTSGGTATYRPGASYTPTSNTTLYAKWETAGRIISIDGCTGLSEGEIFYPTVQIYWPFNYDYNSELKVTYGGATITATYKDVIALPGAADNVRYYRVSSPFAAVIGATVTAELPMDTMTVEVTGKETDPATPGVTQYTVTYLPGTYEGATVEAQNMPGSGTVTEGKTYYVNGNTPTAAGYTFKGWSGSDGKTYQPGQTISNVTGNIALTAQWSRNTVTITWPTDLPTGVTGSDGWNTTTVNEGSPVSFTLTLAEGYDPSTLTVTANGVALAGVKGTDGKYTYSFQANSDTAIAVSTPSKLTYTVALPSGSNFYAWFTAPDAAKNKSTAVLEYGSTYSFTVKPVDGYTVKAVYVNGTIETADNSNVYTVGSITGPQDIRVEMETVKFYTVTLILEGDLMLTQQVQSGETFVPPNAPAKTGYTFDSWYTDAGYTTGYTNGTVTADLILYGRYTANTNTISFDGNAPGGENVSVPTPVTKTYGQAVTLPESVPTCEGYRFLGWAISDAAAAASYQPGATFSTELSGDIILYAVWEQLTYTVTLPSGTGYSVGTTQSTTVAHGEDFKFTVTVDRDYAAKEPTVTVGGATQQNGSPVSNDDGSKTYTYTISGITEDTVVSVTVLKNSIYTVTYQVDGATYQTAQVPYGEKAAQIAAPVKEGYTFSGWCSDVDCETPFNFDTAISGDTTIYGAFTVNTFTVTAPTVPANAGWSTTATDTTVDYNGSYEFTITVAEGYDASNMTVGVNGLLLAPTAENGNVYSYKISAIQSDMEITVSGVVRRTVTITYNDNGGYGGPGQQVVNYYLNGAGDNGTITSVTPTRVGYTFLGWATTNNATKVDYAADDNATFTADTVLYAVWEATDTTVTLAADKQEQYEGQTVTLTATVKDGANPVTSGSVEFFRKETPGKNVSLGIAPVNGGQATFQATMSDYNAQSGIQAKYDTFYAKFIPSGSYDEGTSGEVEVLIRSTAITWALGDDGSMKTDADKLTIKQGDQKVDSMTAGKTYTLAIPAVYALDDGTTALTSGTDYTVTWQKQTAGQSWETLNTTDTELTVTSYVAGDAYRAMVTPVSPYGKTVVYGAGNAITGEGTYLVTQTTGAVTAQKTTITIDVAQTNDVNNTTAQFEGEQVWLHAYVSDAANERLTMGDGAVNFYRWLGTGEPTDDDYDFSTTKWQMIGTGEIGYICPTTISAALRFPQ